MLLRTTLMGTKRVMRGLLLLGLGMLLLVCMLLCTALMGAEGRRLLVCVLLLAGTC